jgi:predicted AAA+ superfamily ATPase
MVKSPKSYFVDSSLLCHLLQRAPEEIRSRDPQLFGRLVENFVATELVKQLAASATRIQLWHFRTSDGKEVDFVLERSDGRLAGIEVKARDAVESRDFAGLRELQSRTGQDFAIGVVLYGGRETVAFGERLWAVPHALLWA